MGNTNVVAKCKDAVFSPSGPLCQASTTPDELIKAINDKSHLKKPRNGPVFFDIDPSDDGPFMIGNTQVTLYVRENQQDDRSYSESCTATVTVPDDEDGDGIPCLQDVCRDTPKGQITFQTGQFAGCSIPDICQCEKCTGTKQAIEMDRLNYLDCVGEVVDEMFAAGVISSERKKNQIMDDAARKKKCCLASNPLA